MIETPDDPFWIEVRRAATPAACRKFGLTLLLGLPVAGLVWFGLLRLAQGQWNIRVPVCFALAGLVVGGALALFPRAGRWPYIVWHTVVRAVELGLTWLLLVILFYGVVLPIGWFRRRNSPNFRGPITAKKTYWHDVPPVKDLARYYRQF